MKRKFYKSLVIFCIVGTVNLLAGCVTTIPVSSSISDFVMMGIRTNSQNVVNLEIISNIQDGEIAVMNENETGQTGRVILHQGAVLTRMINDYMAAKFSRMSDLGDTQITITLHDFIVRDWTTDGAGMQALRALSENPRSPRMVSARVTARIEIVFADGTEEARNFISNTEEHYIGQFTSEIGNRAFATAVNNANNRLLMQMNAFFEEIGL